MPKLAESRFVTGPKDPLAVADVYEITENAIRNRAEDVIDEIAELLGGVRLKFEDYIPEAVMEEVEAILSALSNAVKSMINALSPGLAQLVSGGDTGSALSFVLTDFPIIWDLGASQLEVPQTEQAFMQDLDKFIKERKRKTGRQPPKTNTLNNGEGSSVNQAAQHMVYSRLTEEMIKRGLTDAIPELLNTLTKPDIEEAVALSVIPVALNPTNASEPDNAAAIVPQGPLATNETEYYTAPTFTAANPLTDTGTTGKRPYTNEKLASQIKALDDANGVRGNLPALAFDFYTSGEAGAETDLDAIKLLLERIPFKLLLSRHPGIVKDILKGVVYTKDTDTNVFFTQLITILETIDPEWFLTERNEEKIPDLNVLRFASPHARTLLITHGSGALKDAALIAHRFGAFDINTLLKQQYPFINL